MFWPTEAPGLASGTFIGVNAWPDAPEAGTRIASPRTSLEKAGTSFMTTLRFPVATEDSRQCFGKESRVESQESGPVTDSQLTTHKPPAQRRTRVATRSAEGRSRLARTDSDSAGGQG